MAVIRPFQGLRYSAEAGSIDSLTAPPYDVLSPQQRDSYAARNEHNVVRLTLPEQRPDDRSKFIKYGRSAELLNLWRNDGTLLREDRPAIYRYTQKFHLPHGKDPLVRTSIVALIKIEPYDKGVILAHEETFPKHKEDRLRILEATRSHLECIFGLYEDPNGLVLNSIESAPGGARVIAHSDDGVVHEFEPITDEASLAELQQALADKKIWIADGHHRYETALAFRQSLGDRNALVAEDFIVMALSSMSDPGLVMLPTHRIVDELPVTLEEALTSIGEYFDIRPVHSSRLVEHLRSAETEGRRGEFGMACEGGRGYVLTPKDHAAVINAGGSSGSDTLRALDVTILHDLIFAKLLGRPQLEGITYTRDAFEAVRAADLGAAAAFLMAPPSGGDMKTIALSGEKMPQKSTFYFPKILSGLVIWSLNDF